MLRDGLGKRLRLILGRRLITRMLTALVDILNDLRARLRCGCRSRLGHRGRGRLGDPLDHRLVHHGARLGKHAQPADHIGAKAHIARTVQVERQLGLMLGVTEVEHGLHVRLFSGRLVNGARRGSDIRVIDLGGHGRFRGDGGHGGDRRIGVERRDLILGGDVRTLVHVGALLRGNDLMHGSGRLRGGIRVGRGHHRRRPQIRHGKIGRGVFDQRKGLGLGGTLLNRVVTIGRPILELVGIRHGRLRLGGGSGLSRGDRLIEDALLLGEVLVGRGVVRELVTELVRSDRVHHAEHGGNRGLVRHRSGGIGKDEPVGDDRHAVDEGDERHDDREDP